jgi:hypothetical protein
MQNLCGGAFGVVGADGKIGHFIDIVREWVYVMRIRFADKVMNVQGSVHCHLK